jgi:hypothetical protein
LGGHLVRRDSISATVPCLYNIVRRKHVLVVDVLSVRTLNIEFRRALTGNKWDTWLLLVQRLMMVNLIGNICVSLEKDVFVWKLNTSGAFIVKSMYSDLMNGHTFFYGNTFGN